VSGRGTCQIQGGKGWDSFDGDELNNLFSEPIRRWGERAHRSKEREDRLSFFRKGENLSIYWFRKGDVSTKRGTRLKGKRRPCHLSKGERIKIYISKEICSGVVPRRGPRPLQGGNLYLLVPWRRKSMSNGALPKRRKGVFHIDRRRLPQPRKGKGGIYEIMDRLKEGGNEPRTAFGEKKFLHWLRL